MTSQHTIPRSSNQTAFSLVELLVVMAIFALMAVIALPSIGNITQSTRINQAGQLLGDQIILARQEAVSKNRDVEVRIIKFQDGFTPGYRAVQLWLRDPTGTNPTPVGAISKFPDGVVISDNPTISPLLTSNTGNATFGGLGTKDYGGFRIRASGSLPATVTTTNNFLTVQLARDPGIPATNFYAVRVNPVTGRLTFHRP